MKTCPFCAEEIQDAAIKCKHCGEFLDASRTAGHELPWYFRTSAIVIAVFCIGPLALPMLWWRPRTPAAWKIAWTVAVLALTWLSVLALRDSWGLLQESWPLLIDPYGI